jgi:hypothetical protein
VARSTPLSSVDGPTVEEVAVSAVDLDEVESGFLASATTLDDFLQQTTRHIPLDSIKVGLLELVDVLRGHRDGVRILARLERDLRRANDCVCPSAQHRSPTSLNGLTIVGPSTDLFGGHGPSVPSLIMGDPLHPRRERGSLPPRMGELDTDFASVGVDEVDDALEAHDVRVVPDTLNVSAGAGRAVGMEREGQ